MKVGVFGFRDAVSRVKALGLGFQDFGLSMMVQGLKFMD